MPDIFDATGLTVKTKAEIVSDLTTGLTGIYGADANVDSNSEDGQLIGIIAQMAADIRELAQSINAGFNPVNAVGVTLDQRVSTNGIQRDGGTYTIVPVDITVNQTVTLAGLDDDANDPNGTGYSVQDGAGNEYILLDTVTLTAGTTTLDFRAQLVGVVQPTAGTITTPVTIVVGVTTINNSSSPVSIGQAEEVDAQLRIRQQQSVALASSGYLNGMEGKILALTGVIDAKAYENDGDAADANGIPAHGIWLVVNGGANTDIAAVMYATRTAGVPQKGAVAVPITKQNGDIITFRFDRPAAQNLYIRFNIKKLTTAAAFDTGALASAIAQALTYKIGKPAETSAITAAAVAALQAAGGQGVPLDVQISSGGTSVTLPANPFTTLGAGSPLVHVNFPAHGLVVGQTFNLPTAPAAAIDGIPAADFSGTFTVEQVTDVNGVNISVNAEAAAGGVTGGGIGLTANNYVWTDYLATATPGSEWTVDPSRITATVVS